MAPTHDLNPRIVDALYAQALDLTERSRAAFDVAILARPDGLGSGGGYGRGSGTGYGRGDRRGGAAARTLLAREAMRATTRMMHAMAWLLNQRAYLAGQMTEFQLRRLGRLPPAPVADDPGQLAGLDPVENAGIRAIVLETEGFYARLERLDAAWQSRFAVPPGAVHRLRERLGSAVALG